MVDTDYLAEAAALLAIKCLRVIHVDVEAGKLARANSRTPIARPLDIIGNGAAQQEAFSLCKSHSLRSLRVAFSDLVLEENETNGFSNWWFGLYWEPYRNQLSAGHRVICLDNLSNSKRAVFGRIGKSVVMPPVSSTATFVTLGISHRRFLSVRWIASFILRG